MFILNIKTPHGNIWRLKEKMLIYVRIILFKFVLNLLESFVTFECWLYNDCKLMLVSTMKMVELWKKSNWLCFGRLVCVRRAYRLTSTYVCSSSWNCRWANKYGSFKKVYYGWIAFCLTDSCLRYSVVVIWFVSLSASVRGSAVI